MVAVKAHQAGAFIKAPDKALRCFLFYGPDAGMASERAMLLAKTLAKVGEPAGDIIRIEETDLDQDGDRMLVELRTSSMFGGSQIIRTSAGRRINAAMLKPAVEDGDLPNYLVVEAGNLKPTDAMRKLFEKTKTAAAIACYPDETRDLAGLVDEALKAAGMTIARDAKDVLISRLGADRALSRNEVEKLALYAKGKGEITVDDVEAIVGDASELALDKIVLAAASGNAAVALREFDRVVSSGDSPQTVILAAQRYFQRLHRVRGTMDGGKRIDDALKSLRPPIHFKQKTVFSAHARDWSTARLSLALARINTATRDARLTNTLEATLIERLLLELTRLAAAR